MYHDNYKIHQSLEGNPFIIRFKTLLTSCSGRIIYNLFRR